MSFLLCLCSIVICMLARVIPPSLFFISGFLWVFGIFFVIIWIFGMFSLFLWRCHGNCKGGYIKYAHQFWNYGHFNYFYSVIPWILEVFPFSIISFFSIGVFYIFGQVLALVFFFFEAIKNEIVLLTSFLVSLLEKFRKASSVSMLILHLVTLLYVYIRPKRVF
jgi:hypothetical protein